MRPRVDAVGPRSSIHPHVGAASPDVTAGGAGTDVRPATFGFMVRCSFALARTHYDVVRDGERHVVGRPWPVVPALGFEYLP